MMDKLTPFPVASSLKGNRRTGFNELLILLKFTLFPFSLLIHPINILCRKYMNVSLF